MPDPRRHWNKELEAGKPDSRLGWLKRESTMIYRGRLAYERVFCANCGCEGGGVTPEWAAHVFYVCEECAQRLGPPPGCEKVPDEEVARHSRS
jgi:hypothetical protein